MSNHYVLKLWINCNSLCVFAQGLALPIVWSIGQRQRQAFAHFTTTVAESIRFPITVVCGARSTMEGLFSPYAHEHLHALKGLALPCVSSGEIALSASRCLCATHAAAPVLFAHAFA